MVVMNVIDESLGYGRMAGMLVGGVLLVILGLGHVVLPADAFVGALLSMLDGVNVSNQLGNIPGLFVRVVGAFVALLGWDIVKESM